MARVILGLIAGLLLILATACVVPETEESSPEPPVELETPSPTVPSAPTPATPEIAESGAITLTLWHPEQASTSRRQPGGLALQEQYAAFVEMYPKLGVQSTIMKPEGRGGMLDYLAATQRVKPSSLPDLILLRLEDIPEAADQGLLQPLDSLSLEPAIDELYPFARSVGLVEGIRLAIPYEVDLQLQVYDGAILDSPTIEAAAAISPPVGFLFPFADPGLGGGDAVLLQYLSAGGPGLLDEKAPLDQEILSMSLNLYVQIEQRGLIHAATYSTTLAAESWQRLAAGQAFMVQTTAHEMLTGRGAPAEMRCAVIPTVGGEPATLVRGWAWAITAADPTRKQAALALLSWLLESENLAARCAASGYLPARAGAANAMLGGHICQPTLDLLLLRGISPPDSTRYQEIRRWAQSALAEVLAGIDTPEGAAAKIAALAEQIELE